VRLPFVPTSEDVYSARIEPGVHAVFVELDLVKPIGAVRYLLGSDSVWVVAGSR
jgi:hypothetical protein